MSEKVLEYFREISKIPRGSGNTKGISDYLVSFADKNGLKVIQDKVNNVIIFRDADEGLEGKEPVVMQGHMDMVCEKTPESQHDFNKDGLELYEEEGFLKARGTTLGGDDGIAVAMMMAMLTDRTRKYPALECIFTVDEETGMEGAFAIDLSPLKGRYMVNLDSEEEGIFVVGCAGGVNVKSSLEIVREPVTQDFKDSKYRGITYEIVIKGLLGGHSGNDINLGRANAVKILGRLIKDLAICGIDVGFKNAWGGGKANVIPNEAHLVVESFANVERFKALVESSINKYSEEYRDKDPGITVEIEILDDARYKDWGVWTKETLEKVLVILNDTPYGVERMDAVVTDCVETSNNFGVLTMDEQEMKCDFLIRSSVKDNKLRLADRIANLIGRTGAKTVIEGEYPGWQVREDSHLQRVCKASYEKLYKKQPVVEAIHAGVECGILLEKKPDMDIVSLGPDLFDIHTVNERMDIQSVYRTYELVLDIIDSL